MNQCDLLDKLSKQQLARVVPVFGSAFLPGVSTSEGHIPSWETLCQRVMGLMEKDPSLTPADLADAQLFWRLRDHVSLLSLLDRRTYRFHQMLEHIFDVDWTTQVTMSNLEPWQVFAATAWKAIASSNIDSLLEVSQRGEQQVSYASPHLREVFEQALNSPANEVQALRLMGRWRDAYAPPLMTWDRLVQQFQLPASFIEYARTHLVSMTPRAERVAYSKALSNVLPKSADLDNLQIRESVAFFRYLYTDCQLILIGLNDREPWWLVFQWLCRELETPHTHYWLGPSPRSILRTEIVHVDMQLDSFATFAKELFGRMQNTQRQAGGEGKEQVDRYRFTELVARYRWNELGSRGITWVDCYQPDESSQRHVTAVVPFIELWANRHILDMENAVQVRLSRDATYLQPNTIRFVRDKYWDYRNRIRQRQLKPEPQINEIKPRVSHYQSASDGSIEITIEPVEYKDYLVTNHFVANVGEQELTNIGRGDRELADLIRKAYTPDRQTVFSPRERLCPTAKAIVLSESAICSNHLGASASLVADYYTTDGAHVDVIVCPPSGHQVSSPGEIIPAISGSMDWPLPAEARSWEHYLRLGDRRLLDDSRCSFSPRREIVREFYEECLAGKSTIDMDDHRLSRMAQAIEYSAAQLQRLEIVNFCQNIQRGGKPEFFAIASLRFSANHFLRHVFRPNWELKHAWWDISRRDIFTFVSAPRSRKVQLFPSPVNRDLQLSDHWQESADFLLRVVRDNAYNPVLRAALVAVFRYVQFAFPDTSETWMRKSKLPAGDEAKTTI